MPLQKTFTFTSSGTNSNTLVFLPTVGEQTTGIFTATVENVVETGGQAIATVLFTSSAINYAKNYTFIPSGSVDLITQSYVYLQTLPAFSGSIVI
jgi:hypothetical protein